MLDKMRLLLFSSLERVKKKNIEYLQLTVKRVYTCRRRAHVLKQEYCCTVSLLVPLLQSEKGKDYGSSMRAISKSTALKETFSCGYHPIQNKKGAGCCCEELYNNTTPNVPQ